MELLSKIAACAALTVMLTAVIRRGNGALGLAISLGACAVLAAAGIGLFSSARATMQTLTAAAGIRSETAGIVLKVCVIGLLTQFCESFCREAGSPSVGKIVEFCGALAAVSLSLPLLESVFSIIGDLLGG